MFISKRCLYNVVRVKYLKSETPPLRSIPVVKDVKKFFPNQLPIIPLEWEIYFNFDLSSDTKPISIYMYRMAPTELKEFKSYLKDLLDKDFIQPNISIWVAPVLFV